MQDAMRSEREEASHAGLPQPYNITAGDMNAALFKEVVQRTKLDTKNTKHQKFIKDLRLHTTDFEKHPHRHYTLCHRTDNSQDSRIDNILISQNTTYLCHLLETRSCPNSTALKAKIKNSGPRKDLKELKDLFGQETGTSAANLIHELDSTLELAYTMTSSSFSLQTCRSFQNWQFLTQSAKLLPKIEAFRWA